MRWVVQECELPWLVEHFDRLLRLYGRRASNSIQVSDTLTVATQRSAASFREVVEGMCEGWHREIHLKPHGKVGQKEANRRRSEEQAHHDRPRVRPDPTSSR